MTGADLRRRQGLNWPPEKLGELLAEPGDRITGWEDLDGPLPRPIARQMEWALAVAEREKAMEACPVPPCQVAERIGATLDPKKRSSAERVMAEFDAHERDCRTCQARKAYAERLPPLPPIPLPGWMSALVALGEQVRRLPAWLQPAAVGALVVGGLTLFRAALMLLLQRRFTADIALAVATAIGVGAVGGAAGGLAYGAVRPPTRGLGRIGDALTGIACVYACLLAIGLPYVLITGPAKLGDPVSIIMVLVIGTGVGVGIGLSWFKPDSDEMEGA